MQVKTTAGAGGRLRWRTRVIGVAVVLVAAGALIFNVIAYNQAYLLLHHAPGGMDDSGWR